MAQPKDQWASLGPLKGQNSTDNPLSLGEGWATATENIVIDPPTSLATKRRGSARFANLPSNTYLVARQTNPLGVALDTIYAFTESAGTYALLASTSGGAFASIGSWPSTVQCIRALNFNNKLFFATYTSSTNRMYVLDGTVRFVGLGVSVAPTVANTGAGAYAATLRYYKVDWVNLASGTNAVKARSELSPAVSFTPSGAGTAARVTKPATLEHATHWRVWGSADGTTYRKISGNIVVATTTYDDSVNPADYSGDFPEEVGTFLPPPAVTRIATDGNRLILGGMGVPTSVVAGTGESVPSQTRVWYTPVLGSLDQGDDERIPVTSFQRNYFDIGDPPGNIVCELEGPCDGQFFVFTQKQPWRLVGTGDVTTPYVAYPVTSIYGASSPPHRSEVSAALGESESGQPTIYFCDTSAGLYRVGVSGDVQFVSYDIQDEIQALLSRVNTSSLPHVMSWPDAKQTWWVWSLTNPSQIVIYVFHWKIGRADEANRVRQGWTRWVMAEANAYVVASVLYNKTPGTNTMAAKLQVPHVLQYKSHLYEFDQDTALDGLTRYDGSLTAAPMLVEGARAKFRVGNPVLVATEHQSHSLMITATRDFGNESRSALVDLSPDTPGETRVVRTVEGLFQSDVTCLEMTIGDAPDATGTELWQIDFVTLPSTHQQPR